MRWIIYNILFAIGYFLMMPSFLRRMWKRGGYRAHFGQRLGRYKPEVAAALAARERIWVHAVSVGESFVAGKLLEELRGQSPDLAFVLSTTSSTGYEVCRQFVNDEDVLIYFPTDFPHVVRRALDVVRPKALVLTESELWLNMLRACERRGIPLYLANGRISDRSFPRYRLLRGFFAPVLRSFRLLMAQYEMDRERLIAMGADSAAVRVMGNVKFDVVPPDEAVCQRMAADLRSYGFAEGATVLLGASTWPGEEAVLLQAYRDLRERHPDLRLILVPRHMERGDEVEAAVVAAGYECLRRSRILRQADGPGEVADDAVLLADTTGELLAFHTLATVVFVGKTLDPSIGGQNMIEPAALGRAVIVGPHTENFAGAMAILRGAEALREIADATELASEIGRLLDDPDERAALGQRAAETVVAQAGVVYRSASAILADLEKEKE